MRTRKTAAGTFRAPLRYLGILLAAAAVLGVSMLSAPETTPVTAPLSQSQQTQDELTAETVLLLTPANEGSSTAAPAGLGGMPAKAEGAVQALRNQLADQSLALRRPGSTVDVPALPSGAPTPPGTGPGASTGPVATPSHTNPPGSNVTYRQWLDSASASIVHLVSASIRETHPGLARLYASAALGRYAALAPVLDADHRQEITTALSSRHSAGAESTGAMSSTAASSAVAPPSAIPTTAAPTETSLRESSAPAAGAGTPAALQDPAAAVAVLQKLAQSGSYLASVAAARSEESGAKPAAQLWDWFETEIASTRDFAAQEKLPLPADIPGVALPEDFMKDPSAALRNAVQALLPAQLDLLSAGDQSQRSYALGRAFGTLDMMTNLSGPALDLGPFPGIEPRPGP